MNIREEATNLIICFLRKQERFEFESLDELYGLISKEPITKKVRIELSAAIDKLVSNQLVRTRVCSGNWINKTIRCARCKRKIFIWNSGMLQRTELFEKVAGIA